jgi:Cu-processing system ATP-binding protein
VTATVKIEHGSKRYGKIEAVRDVSLALAPGQTVALVGHNGAGKTTLLKLMLGHVRPTSGTIRVLGDDPVAGEFEARRKIGFLPENVSFNPALTGREILTFYTLLKGAPVATALELLERVGLGPASARRVGTYSKGMRQRLGLAQALIGEPKLLLLDEPTTGLDPALRLSFYEILQTLRDRGATVVLSSHALAELGERADRVVIMGTGTLLVQGSVEELRRMARLPAKIRLTVSGETETIRNWLDRGETWRQVNGHVVEIDAAPERKIELLRRATDVGAPIEDVDVTPPTLDDIYAHFLRMQGPGR